MSDPELRQEILVVDDTPDNLSLISGILKERFKVKVATGGEKALAICAAKAPSLILLDIMMPEMDGFEVCRRLKASPATASIPVIFLSALATEDDRAQALRLGATGFLVKPVDPDALFAAIALSAPVGTR